MLGLYVYVNLCPYCNKRFTNKHILLMMITTVIKPTTDHVLFTLLMWKAP